MLSKFIVLSFVLCLIRLSRGFGIHTTPSTSCTSVGDNNHHTRFVTRTDSCTNTFTHGKTTVTSTSTPISTSTLYETSTETAATSTNTATATETDTVTSTSTSTQINTATTTSTSVITSTHYWPTASSSAPAARKRAPTPPAKELKVKGKQPSVRLLPKGTAGVLCVIAKCTTTAVLSTTTITTALPVSTQNVTSTVVTTVTPNASVTTTTTVSSTSILTATAIQTTTTTKTVTSTYIYTPTPTFYILGEGGLPLIPNNAHLFLNPLFAYESFPYFNSSNPLGTAFFLDPPSGTIYNADDATYYEAAGVAFGGDPEEIVFAPVASLLSAGGAVCDATINRQTFALTLDCGGGLNDPVTLNLSPSLNRLYIAQPSNAAAPYRPISLKVMIIDQN